MPQLDTVLKRFEQPDEVRTFAKGKCEVVNIAGMTVGRAADQPGWKWSHHVAPPLAHRARTSSTSGWCFPDAPPPQWRTAGFKNCARECCSTSHPDLPDTTVGSVGDEPYVSLHFLGAAHYALK